MAIELSVATSVSFPGDAVVRRRNGAGGLSGLMYNSCLRFFIDHKQIAIKEHGQARTSPQCMLVYIAEFRSGVSKVALIRRG